MAAQTPPTSGTPNVAAVNHKTCNFQYVDGESFQHPLNQAQESLFTHGPNLTLALHTLHSNQTGVPEKESQDKVAWTTTPTEECI